MPPLRLRNLGKSFTLHLQGGVAIPVLSGLTFDVGAGECTVLRGPSGTGKSTVLKLVYGTYKAGAGEILLAHAGAVIDLAAAAPRTILEVRRHTLGYVSQFLRVLPRVAALDVVAEPLIARGIEQDAARLQARALLHRLNIPERLMGLPPATFSGGEQQRVNIARGFIHRYPVLLLDEPTASLDAENREVVIGLIEEARAQGSAVLGIFHDNDVRERVATATIDLAPQALAA